MANQNEKNMEYYKVGLGNVGSYQASGVPYATGSLSLTTAAVEITFPYVTQEVVVYNQGPNALRVGWSHNGVNGLNENNYFLVGSGSNSGRLRVKTSAVYLRSESTTGAAVASVNASLTRIETARILDNWTGSSGVG